jgi:mRNA interferase MazF
MPHIPEAGDLVWTDFDPPVGRKQCGREQSGRRPALVVSPGAFNRAAEFSIVCPIASRVRPFGFSVVLPPGLPIGGEVLTGHVRSIDLRARPIVFASWVPDAVLEEVRGKLAALLGM